MSTDFDSRAQSFDQDPSIERAHAVALAIHRQIELSPTMDTLDFGAGTGLVSLLLAPFVRHVLAVDSSRGMLDVLDAKTEERDIENVATAQLDFIPEGSMDSSFDLVVSVMTLHHIADTEQILRMFRRMLRPGGFLALADLDTEDGTFHPDSTGIEHFGFDRERLRGLLESIGFTRIEASTAHTMSKEIAGGEIKDFPIFLITAKAAD